jgi:iron complex transport system ATP-binding protein
MKDTGPGRPDPAVRAEDLVLAHGDHIALAGGSFEVPRGSSVAVIGPNGSGKSSVLDAIAGLMAVAGGTLDVLPARTGPTDSPDKGSAKTDRTGGTGVAYVLQSTEIPAHLPMTVREVVSMGRYRLTGLLRPMGRDGHRAVAGAMDRVGVADLAERQVLELSGGQRQRVLVAQGLAGDAALLLMDEPMTGLDLVSADRIRRVIVDERAAGRTVMFSTHDLSEAATADRVILLAGRVVACGPPEEVLVEANLMEAYRGRVVGIGGVTVIDDPHHHGSRTDRHDGHDHG